MAANTTFLPPEILAGIASFIDNKDLYSCHLTQIGLRDIRNEMEIFQSFCKHGHLIRHLKIHHPILIDAAFFGGACANLLSLEVFCLSNRTTEATVHAEAGRPLLNPIFQDVFVQDPPGIGICLCRTHLQRLRLDRTIDRLARLISAAFFRESILMLKNLTQLHNEFQVDRCSRTPGSTSPPAETRHARFVFLPSSRPIPLANRAPSFCWTTIPSHLRSVQLSVSIQTRTFFMILAHLPGLVSLTVFSIQGDDFRSQEIYMIMRGTPSNFQTPRTNFCGWYYHSAEKVILLWLPRLRRIFCSATLDAVATDLVRHCPPLEEYHYNVYGGSIFTSSVRTSNIPNILLRGCPNLRLLNGLPHRIRADEFGKEPWAATNLEIFRAHILQQERILEKLGSLMRLRELGFGYEYWDIWKEKAPFDPMASSPTRTYRPYGGPIFNTLELSLQMGLQKLARLEDLGVFGFRGVNHRITERELRWMAESWPKLKVMRGLKLRELKDAKPDRRMDQLRNFIISLQPRVEHPMLGAEQ
ncbi:MAG: hypothetical protein J3R72DRAFT_491410 [Linnemannia gamsii]|nr:MAG: hypothetical protein J3R72DRAFT_491410 [Linnemannia gamsii]